MFSRTLSAELTPTLRNRRKVRRWSWVEFGRPGGIALAVTDHRADRSNCSTAARGRHLAACRPTVTGGSR